MNREPSFPHDWIAPGEYRYCSCGYTLVSPGTMICAKCHRKPTLGWFTWPSYPLDWWMFVSWVRITLQQAWQLTISAESRRLYAEARQRRAELRECQETHDRLFAERNALAEKRRSEGVKPLFWLEDKK